MQRCRNNFQGIGKGNASPAVLIMFVENCIWHQCNEATERGGGTLSGLWNWVSLVSCCRSFGAKTTSRNTVVNWELFSRVLTHVHTLCASDVPLRATDSDQAVNFVNGVVTATDRVISLPPDTPELVQRADGLPATDPGSSLWWIYPKPSGTTARVIVWLLSGESRHWQGCSQNANIFGWTFERFDSHSGERKRFCGRTQIRNNLSPP